MIHPASQAVLDWFEYGHLPGGAPRDVSQGCAELAHTLAGALDDTEAGAELTTGLRKLLEAKDCFVRAALKLPASG